MTALYRVIEHEDAARMAAEVMLAMESGWALHGSLQIIPAYMPTSGEFVKWPMYVQAMIKVTKPILPERNDPGF